MHFNAAAHEHSNSEDAAIYVNNIPEDMVEETLKMIIENRGLGGRGKVKNIIIYKTKPKWAAITLSDPAGRTTTLMTN